MGRIRGGRGRLEPRAGGTRVGVCAGQAEGENLEIVHAGLAEGGAAEVSISASNGAELVVVGSRGRGGFASKLAGSISHAVVQFANCPVFVIRVPDENVR